MKPLTKRIKTFKPLAKKFDSISDQQLYNLLKDADPLHTGIGSKSMLLDIDDTKIFVKKIPLTDLERKPENIKSTVNLFDLPFFYHIGVGSAGFSAWRELFVHLMTTKWIISGACANFPILYHWRMLPSSKPEPMSPAKLAEIERDVEYWDNDNNIKQRLEALHNASAHIYLFLEYIPQSLFTWLKNKLLIGGKETAAAIAFVELKLRETNEFMQQHGLLHFDAHFENILADDDGIYFSDFGLSLSNEFAMSNSEIILFDEYQTYDQCSTITNFLHCIISCLYDTNAWELKLSDYLNGKLEELEPAIADIINRYGAIGLVMDQFYQQMQKNSKSTPYPAELLEKLLLQQI